MKTLRGKTAQRRETGIGTLEMVGIVLVAALLVAGTVAAVVAQAPSVEQTVRCKIEQIMSVAQDGEAVCLGDGDQGPGGPGGTDPGDPGDDPFDPDTPIANPEDPDDPRCKDALPSSSGPNPRNPTLVQVGCRNLYVPKDCKKEWDAYNGAADTASWQAAAGPLGTCVADTYDRIETPCVVSAVSEADRTEVRVLFVKFGNSDGMLVEELGDGRVRIHLLEGAELGGEVSGSGKGIDFSVGGVTGYENGNTYEFEDMTKGQEWLDWYQEYRGMDEKIRRAQANVHSTGCPGACPASPTAQIAVNQLKEKKKELQEKEPEHHALATSSVNTRKFQLSGGLSLPGAKKKGSSSEGSVGPSIAGDYTSEVQVEQRDFKDGSMAASYKSSDAGGFLIGVKVGGKGQKEGKDDKGGASGGDSLGKEWKGSSATTALWDKDGEIKKLIVTFDQQAMESVNKAGIDLNLVLPYGFGLSGGYEHVDKEGKSSVTEMILDFDQHPELREVLGPRIDEMFPKDEDGDLKKDDVTIEFPEEQDESVDDVVDQHANVRDLYYDVKETEQTGTVGVDFVGIDLFKASWTHVESSKELTGSQFTVTDVNGDKQTITPSPKCRDEKFEVPDGYYSSDFSDPIVA